MKQKTIFKLFLYNKELRFSEIEAQAGIRSNELAYYLKQLQAKGVLEKQGEFYRLTPEAQKKIPYFHEKDAQSPLAVVLVRCERDDGAVLLVKREKRPYEGLWGMPGGRIILGETIEQSAKRLLKEKTFLDCEFLGVHAVCNERVRENGIKYGFVMLVVHVAPTSTIKQKPNVAWFKEAPSDTIPSDAFFVNAEPGFYECVLTPIQGTVPMEYTSVIAPAVGLTPAVR